LGVKHFDQVSFESEIINGKGKALVDFWAPWCGPCRILGPVIEQLADELDGSLVVGKVDVDEQSNIAARYGVMTIPTVILFNTGVEVKRTVGAQPKERLLEFVK
jgi:thioredoxin 1